MTAAMTAPEGVTVETVRGRLTTTLTATASDPEMLTAWFEQLTRDYPPQGYATRQTTGIIDGGDGTYRLYAIRMNSCD